MWNKAKLRTVLSVMNFHAVTEEIMEKKYQDGSVIRVDLKKQQITYPEDAGMVVNERRTCNIKENENFVVLECIDRLLTKGYFATTIELEPKLPLGHRTKACKGIILVREKSGKVLFIVQCKTAGNEFKREWNRIQAEAGPLFSYGWHARKVSFLCLYTCDLAETEDKIIFQNYVISIADNKAYLEERKEDMPLSYNATKSPEDLFYAWSGTYQREYKTRGIFERDIPPYEPGKRKYFIDELKPVELRDIQRKYHEFTSILRQHNVSGKENAFDKLVNLFLCKIVDEKSNPNNLQFRWKGLSFDTPFALHDRLQQLYKEGMENYLQEDITYIDNQQIDQAFRLFNREKNVTKNTIMEYIRQLKFFSNSDFSFIEVHNKKLYYRNFTILLKIVQMLEDIMLSSEKENQFLGDLFEGFLDQGMKQWEGQFFTPIPMVKFIVSSLCLKDMTINRRKPLKVLDYACGAGHFLNEYTLHIKNFLPDGDKEKQLSSLYGIEKEYRLSKVAKVSSFMYGQDDVKIINGDALSDLSEQGIVPGTFDVILSNPPYSVKGFLETLSNKDRRSYSLIDMVDPKSYSSNSSIEAFFIERTAQLLGERGICAIIVPSTILSNSSKIYERTREIILENFDIIGISEFGSQTFGHTNTNTVVLFLRKPLEKKSIVQNYRVLIDAWFSRNLSREEPLQEQWLLETYTISQGYGLADYVDFLEGHISEELMQNEMFIAYYTDWESHREVKNLKSRSSFVDSSPEEKNALLEGLFYQQVKRIEQKKVYYYLLASSQKNPVVISKAPKKNGAQKEFLGYEWSKAKGNEGIKFYGKRNTPIEKTENLEAEDERILENILSMDHMDTPLFCPHNPEDPAKISYYIKRNFLGEEVVIPDALSKYLSVMALTEMLDFSMEQFENKVTTVRQSNICFLSPYESQKLRQIAEPAGGLWTGQKEPLIKVRVLRNTNFTVAGSMDFSNVPLLGVELSAFEKRRLIKGDIIIEKSGGSETQAVGRVAYFDIDTDENYSYSNFTARLRVKEKRIEAKYLYYILKYVYQQKEIFYYQTGSSGLKNLNMKKYLEIQIPIPDQDTQKKIIAACEAADEEFQTVRKERKDYQEQIRKIFEENGITAVQSEESQDS